jgi:hypothetical protein
MEANTILDLDSILDGNLDSVANIPDFVDPPDAVYMIKVNKAEVVASKTEGKPPLITLTYEVVATLEIKGAPPVADGSLFSERFQATEDGLSYFKRQARNLLQVENVDGASVRTILSTLQEAPAVKAVVSHSTSKSDDGTKEYSNLRLRIVPNEKVEAAPAVATPAAAAVPASA